MSGAAPNISKAAISILSMSSPLVCAKATTSSAMFAYGLDERGVVFLPEPQRGGFLKELFRDARAQELEARAAREVQRVVHVLQHVAHRKGALGMRLAQERLHAVVAQREAVGG